MKLANATNLDRKSGVAQWRDLRFLFRFLRSHLSRQIDHADRDNVEVSGLGSIWRAR